MQASWTNCLFANRADFTEFKNSSSEGSLLAGLNLQPFLPPGYFDQFSFGRGLLLKASGVLSTTGTPTIIFQARLGTTSGSSYLSGTSVGVSAAITTGSGVSNKWWELELLLHCYTPGIGSTNTTLSGAGKVTCPVGFASPYVYSLEPTTPDTATWTSTIDSSLAQYLNLSVTWSAADNSNKITCKNLMLLALN